ncbi:DNA polymerase III, chi subunit [Shimia gijangensis]|uniref:DNA polymerase III, chi subunit n=1 Tax=Shimia gijangensis TaxID=1470563 RepID=A0A1M6HD57_9RHOB|nr:DNA polymerase III subunit chi [Shimia gijangensis]SHJ20059.1 DNA polymerase III, chi subunit [Shimia gijangensis]
MGKALFYHLTRHPVEVTLTTLVGKALEQGWQVLVRGRDAERMDWLDQKLWQTGGDEGFLPHGLAGGPHDSDQPILLTTAPDNTNNAVYLVSIDGAEITRDEVQKAERGVILFDGHDAAALAHARTQWKTLTDAGCPAEYWSEETGRWEKKAEKIVD